jgi:putative spermidine/putrescine transport system substrate-binding protein
VDLVWINGENFATGADADLWFGPWAERLPNARYIAWESPEISRDFGYPVEGREAPWGKAQFVMTYDSKKVKDPPKSAEELRSWVEEHPGRFTYPAPPDFTGNAFVEQMFYEITGDVQRYQKPFNQTVFEERAPKVYEFFNEIEPNLWRSGETYPESSTALNKLYADGEVWLTMSYNPQEAQRQIDKGLFPKSTRTYLLEGGTLANTHYVAIPFDAGNKAGAQVVANFLESPAAQREKLKPEVWGDLPALDLTKLPKDEREGFESPGGPATLSTQELQENRLPEARSEWLLALQKGWREEVLKR